MLEDIRLECARFGAVKSLNVVMNSSTSSSSDGTASGTVSEPEDQLTKNTPDAGDGDRKDKAVESDPCDSRVAQGITLKPENPTTSNNTLSEDPEKKYPESLSAEEPLLPQSWETQGVDIVVSEALKVETSISDKAMVDSTPGLEDEGDADQDMKVSEEAKEESEGDAEPMTLVEPNSSQVTTDGANAAVDACKKDSSSDVVVLEPGSVLVEYMREEATCRAAHSLHGRLFRDRAVSAGYVAHDIYLERFAK